MLKRLFNLNWLGLGIVVVGLVLGLSVRSYIISQNSQEVGINVAKPVSSKMCDEDGSFTTTSDFRYCFIFKAPKTSYGQMKTECKTYGELAVLADGETQQDILDIINVFQDLRSKLAEGYEGGGGPVIFDTCKELVDKFGNDKAIFAENGGGGIECGTTGGKPHKLIFDKELDKGQNGRLNDTNGFFDILGGLCQMKNVPSFQIESFNDENGNKKKDAGEKSTEIEWAFKYSIDGGELKNVKTNSVSGKSKEILALKKGSKVKVTETVKPGWKVTTENPLEKTLDLTDKLYVFQFGNQKIAGASPSPSPSPSASPGTGRPSFQVRKFNDLNDNGKKDENEGSTDLVWKFRYRVTNGENVWKEIGIVNVEKGLTARIVLAKKSVVEVEEFTQSGWKLTTKPINQVKTLTVAGQKYMFNFGNVKTVVPSASAVPVPTPGPDDASFIIHKFLDANKNGVRESGEESTNRTWVFAYQINDGDKKEYKVEAGKTIGDIITVKKNDVIKVSELGQEGWLNTTGAEVTQTLSESKTYTLYFGNWPVDGTVPPPFPPKQPNTGTPTWLTLGALGLVAGLLLVKKYGFR